MAMNNFNNYEECVTITTLNNFANFVPASRMEFARNIVRLWSTSPIQSNRNKEETFPFWVPNLYNFQQPPKENAP